MLAYYLQLALRSLGRNKALTALMVLAVALGIGASMTTLTVFHVLSGDPLPGRSAQLYYPQIDPRDNGALLPGKDPPMQVTLIDGRNLLHARRADRQALMTGGSVPVQPDVAAIDPFYVEAFYTTADFFPMFEVPFLYGHAWSVADDEGKAREVVIGRELNNQLFGGKDSVGRELRLAGTSYRIAGVLDDWRPVPHFYDLNV
ncbi:ABC transporter permease, partial [Frateuria sp.]|uniref:ABC transporter permease n=1 Tax=Frateuria sp. TaxID=2211372 RepID=UPI003F7E5C1A